MIASAIAFPLPVEDNQFVDGPRSEDIPGFPIMVSR
jgi:hypothetical protein